MEHRYWPPSSGSYAPMTYIRGIPVDVTILLIVSHVLTMLITTFLLAFHHESFLASWILFSPTALAEGKIWTAATYAFANDIVTRNIWFAVEMVIFFFTGREVERFIGRNNFVWYYAMLILVPPTLLAPVAWVTGSSFIWLGSWSVHLAILIGFVTIHPNVQFFFGLKAKWVALIYLSVITLMEIAQGRWFSLGQVWLSVGTAWLYLKYNGVGGGLVMFDTWHSWREERADRKIEARRRQQVREVEEEAVSVDEVLEKISQQGIESLSQEERLLLEKASRELSNRDLPGGP
jgi:ribosomal protein L31E